MDGFSFYFSGGIAIFQSLVCLIYACRTNDKIEKINHDMHRLLKSVKWRMEHGQYVPPPATYTSPPLISAVAPTASAPKISDVSSDKYPSVHVNHGV